MADTDIRTVTIAAGQSLSPQIDIGTKSLVGLVVPANWTNAGISFQVSVDGGTTWAVLMDSTTAGPYAIATIATGGSPPRSRRDRSDEAARLVIIQAAESDVRHCDPADQRRDGVARHEDDVLTRGHFNDGSSTPRPRRGARSTLSRRPPLPGLCKCPGPINGATVLHNPLSFMAYSGNNGCGRLTSRGI